MRFSIRSLQLFLALLAIIFSAAAVATHDYRKRCRIKADLLSMGAYYVGCDENSNPDWVSFVAPVSSSQIANFKSIKSIDLSGARVIAAVLAWGHKIVLVLSETVLVFVIESRQS